MLILFLLCAFRSGSDRFYLMKADGCDVTGREIFFYFKPKNVLSLIAFYLNLYSRKLMLLILCFLPSAAVLVFLFISIERGELSLGVSSVLAFAVAVLAVNGIFYFIRFNSFLFLARYYFASGKYFSFRQLFSFAYKTVQGKRRAVLKKRLSFVGWYLSCIFLLPISFVRSYYNRSMAELACDLMEL